MHITGTITTVAENLQYSIKTLTKPSLMKGTDQIGSYNGDEIIMFLYLLWIGDFLVTHPY